MYLLSATDKQAPAGWYHLLDVRVAAGCFAVLLAPPTLSRLPVRLAARSAAGQAGGEARVRRQMYLLHLLLTNRHCQCSITSCCTSLRYAGCFAVRTSVPLPTFHGGQLRPTGWHGGAAAGEGRGPKRKGLHSHTQTGTARIASFLVSAVAAGCC
jgi:hypothetical protein